MRTAQRLPQSTPNVSLWSRKLYGQSVQSNPSEEPRALLLIDRGVVPTLKEASTFPFTAQALDLRPTKLLTESYFDAEKPRWCDWRNALVAQILKKSAPIRTEPDQHALCQARSIETGEWKECWCVMRAGCGYCLWCLRTCSLLLIF
jgi:hypothetical protein